MPFVLRMLTDMPLVFDIHPPWGFGFHPHVCASLYVCPSVKGPSQNIDDVHKTKDFTLGGRGSEGPLSFFKKLSKNLKNMAIFGKKNKT